MPCRSLCARVIRAVARRSASAPPVSGVAWRAAAAALVAATAATGAARAAGAQGVAPSGIDTRTETRPVARTTRKPMGKPAANAAQKPGARPPAARPLRATVPYADTLAPSAPTPVRPTMSDSGGDAAAVAGSPRPPALGADSLVASAAAPPSAPPVPADPNVPGAPNVAGHLTGTLAREAVLAPLVAPVGPGTGAEVLHVQVLLDAARFSPGAMSGVWNENTVFALRAFRAAEKLPPGDSADADVVARLERRVGARAPLTEYTITPGDVRGPFHRLPSGMYAQAHVDCLCYTSLAELLGERFHATTDVLRSLNPGVDFAHARPGTRIVVPNVERGRPPAVARLIVDKRESSIRGLDAKGATRFYLPVTVGSPGLPSPVGRLRVVSATPNPRYHYDPVVLGEAKGVARDALLPPGPNSPVGVLWAQLSRPHVGLHGTPYPEEVGYTMSHGCVRMANWDARWLTPLLQPGLVVDFQ